MSVSEKAKPLVTLVEATGEETCDRTLAIRWGVSHGAFGNIFLARSPRGVTHLSFFDGDINESLEVLRKDWPKAELIRDDSLSIENHRLHVKGTPFQMRVWRALLEISEGFAFDVWGNRRRDRNAGSFPRGGERGGREPHFTTHSLPPRDPLEWRTRRLPLGRGTEACDAPGGGDRLAVRRECYGFLK